MITILGVRFGHLDAVTIAKDQRREAEVLHLQCLAQAEELRMQAGREAERAEMFLARRNRLNNYLERYGVQSIPLDEIDSRTPFDTVPPTT